MLATVLAWSVLAVFVLLAIGALNLQFAMDLVSRTFTYLPQLLIAAALLVPIGKLYFASETAGIAAAKTFPPPTPGVPPLASRL